MGEIERSASPADGPEIAGEHESRGCVTFYTIDQSHAISSQYRLDSLTLDPSLTIYPVLVHQEILCLAIDTRKVYNFSNNVSTAVCTGSSAVQLPPALTKLLVLT